MEAVFDKVLRAGEQQVKTAVTCALNKPCNGYFMQEPSVSRKINTEKKDDTNYSNGYVDYWCRYGENTKISILLEIKHHWINHMKVAILRFSILQKKGTKLQLNK